VKRRRLPGQPRLLRERGSLHLVLYAMPPVHVL